jgi:hypothetical protein
MRMAHSIDSRNLESKNSRARQGAQCKNEREKEKNFFTVDKDAL